MMVLAETIAPGTRLSMDPPQACLEVLGDLVSGIDIYDNLLRFRCDRSPDKRTFLILNN